MKISTKAVSPYLNQEDVPQPIVATMDRVTLVPALRNPHVLHFEGGTPKPIPLNLTNRRALVALYGDDDSGWAGKPIEIYVDPNVNDSKGNRVRHPSAERPPRRRIEADAGATKSSVAAGPKPTGRWAEPGLRAPHGGALNEDVALSLSRFGNLPLNEAQTGTPVADTNGTAATYSPARESSNHHSERGRLAIPHHSQPMTIT